VGLIGHDQAQHMVETQPMKMAAAEALWTTEDPASFSILTIGDLSQRNEVFSIRLPRLLSLMSFSQIDGEVKGIYNLQEEYTQLYGPGDYIPPVAFVYWSFRIMVGAGTLLLLLAFVGLFLVMAGVFEVRTIIYKIFMLAILLPYLANSAGWIMTEVGRVPWIVFGLMVLRDGVSIVVPIGVVATSLIVYTITYAALMGADIYLLRKFAKIGVPESRDDVTDTPEEENLSLIGAQD